MFWFIILQIIQQTNNSNKMHLRSGKQLTTESSDISPPKTDQSTFIKDDFNIVMNVVHDRIKEIEKLKHGEQYTNPRVFPNIIIDQLRILTEMYYLMNYYSDLIIGYINKVNASYATKIILAALDRINFIYNQLMEFPLPFIKKPKMKRTLEPLYHEWEEFIIKYGYLYNEMEKKDKKEK